MRPWPLPTMTSSIGAGVAEADVVEAEDEAVGAAEATR